MARLDPIVRDLASRFVLVRLSRITGLDLRLFDFDHDLNFYVFFLGPDERVLGRYGGRDGKSAEARLSFFGLRHAMDAALESHAEKAKPSPPREGKPVLAENYPAAKRLKKNECIHCHQVNEFRRELAKSEGTWTKDDVFRWPLPENVGISLAVDQGDRINRIDKDSSAERAGLREGDHVRTIGGFKVRSFADATFALDRAPKEGDIEIVRERDGKEEAVKLKVAGNWKRTNITWRPSLLDVLVSPPFFGDDLSAKDKQALGLSGKRLAFRQDSPIPKELTDIGLREGDVIVGLDGLTLEMSAAEFLGFLRRNYLVGEKTTVDVLRGGKAVGLPLKLK